MSAESNAALRERRKNDAEFRRIENENRLRYLARKKATQSGEPIPVSARLVRPKVEDPCDRWFRDSILLNSEDPEVVAIAKRSAIHRFEIMTNLSSAERARVIKASAFFEPAIEKEKEESAEESFGLADDE
jgi:hypothetical protein